MNPTSIHDLAETLRSVSELRERCRCVGRETFENHLQTLPATGGNFVLRADWMLLQRVFGKIMETADAVHNVLPVAKQANVT